MIFETAPDPRWNEFLRSDMVDDAWQEWQERQDRLADHTPACGPGASNIRATRKGAPDDRVPSRLQDFPSVRRIGASPTAAGSLLTPLSEPAASPSKETA